MDADDVEPARTQALELVGSFSGHHDDVSGAGIDGFTFNRE
jgi:hypothetical protein